MGSLFFCHNKKSFIRRCGVPFIGHQSHSQGLHPHDLITSQTPRPPQHHHLGLRISTYEFCRDTTIKTVSEIAYHSILKIILPPKLARFLLLRILYLAPGTWDRARSDNAKVPAEAHTPGESPGPPNFTACTCPTVHEAPNSQRGKHEIN